jgi:glycosyltransferase involved in cell wall biosynthesis
VPALFTEDDGIIGGAERYVFELARHMAEEAPTSLVTFGSRGREERTGALRVRVLGNPWHVRGQRANPFAFALFDEIRRADIIHCHQQHIVASTVSAITARLLGHPVFCTELGGGGWDLSSFVSTDRLYDAHLHISQYSRRIAGHAGQAWAHVIDGGVDTLKFSPDPALPRGAGVLFVGRLLPHKGIDVLIRALPQDLPAEIIGPVCDRQYLDDLHALAAGKQVTFRHDCGDDALVDAYRRALCIVLPSVYNDMYGHHTDVPELLGQTLLEGMACGAPAVCTSVASLPELVEDGITGHVVPPNDPVSLGTALMALANNPARAGQMGAAARVSVTARFTWAAVVEECLRLYGVSESASRGARHQSVSPAHSALQ